MMEEEGHPGRSPGRHGKGNCIPPPPLATTSDVGPGYRVIGPARCCLSQPSAAFLFLAACGSLAPHPLAVLPLHRAASPLFGTFYVWLGHCLWTTLEP
jgi:hypothetical protein